MALPASINTVPVHIEILTIKGRPASGQIHFDVPVVLRNLVEEIIIGPSRLTATLDINGEATILLPATDDPDNLPTGWSYNCVVSTNVWNTTFSVEVPIATSGTLEFATLAPL